MKTPLQAWRARMGWSQREAAASLGVALNTYQQWETGRSWKTGQPVEPPLTALLAAAARERGIPPISDS